MMVNAGFVIWFTGIAGSGKTTLAKLTEDLLRRQGLRVQLIDGDIVRRLFGNDLGYTETERIENIKRIVFAASLLAENNIAVIVANIAPYYEVRNLARKVIKNYLQVYLKAELATVRQRDMKGLYRAYDEGKIKNIVGLDERYDVPRNPDLILDTNIDTPEQCLRRIEDLLARKGLIYQKRAK